LATQAEIVETLLFVSVRVVAPAGKYLPQVFAGTQSTNEALVQDSHFTIS